MKNNLAFVSIFFVLTGCATLTPMAEKVRIADPAQLGEVKDCKELGKVVETSEYGKEQLIIHLKNKAAEMGGNVIVSKLQTEKTYGVMNAADMTQGMAYDCPASVLDKIKSAENF